MFTVSRELLSRLEVMVLTSGVELPIAAVREQIAASIHVIVHQARFACGARRITHVTEVTGVTAGTIQLQDLFRFEPARGARGVTLTSVAISEEFHAAS